MSQTLNERIKAQKKKISNANKYFDTTSRLIDDLYDEILKWREMSHCNSPIGLQRKLESLELKGDKHIDNIQNYKDEIEAWKKATQCKDPEDAKLFIISLQNNDIKQMYNDSLCRTFMWDFNDDKSLLKLIPTLDDFYENMNEIIESLKNGDSDIFDPYNFLGFFIFLKNNNYKMDGLNEILEMINDE